MKTDSLLPDTYIIAEWRGRVMDKKRMICEGIVNEGQEYFREDDKTAGAQGSGGFAFSLREKREREDVLMKSRFTSS